MHTNGAYTRKHICEHMRAYTQTHTETHTHISIQIHTQTHLENKKTVKTNDQTQKRLKGVGQGNRFEVSE